MISVLQALVNTSLTELIQLNRKYFQLRFRHKNGFPMTERKMAELGILSLNSSSVIMTLKVFLQRLNGNINNYHQRFILDGM